MMIQLSINRWWVNGMWCVHTADDGSAVRRSAALTRATMWMNLGSIALSERSQTQRDHVLNSCASRISKSRDRKQILLPGRQGDGSDCLVGTGFLLGAMKMVWN